MHEPEAFLEHYGVKGMKWGIRKEELSKPRDPNPGAAKSGKGWTIDADGAISIQKGTTLSRVVRNSKGLFGGAGVALDSGKPIYSAFTPHDVVAYEHLFGSKQTLFNKNPSTVLKLTATTSLKAPGPKEATAIYYDVLKNDPVLTKQFRDNLPGLTKRSLDKALENPSSKQAYNFYSIGLDSANYNQKTNVVNERYFAAVKKAGYNMLLDPSDSFGGFDAPVMILDGGKNLKTTSQYVVDKASAEKARLAFKSESAKVGKFYLEKLGYF